jgi:branched-subunit amino acid aminotransferase/4-amino-4-deoxychorismate lyase
MKNRTLLFGEGLFETFRVYKGRKLAFVEEHLDRMAEGANFFALPFSGEKALETLSLALEEIPQSSEARLRLNLLCYGDHGAEKSAFNASWEPLQEKNTWQEQGVKLALAPFQKFSGSPLVKFKTTSYLENIFVFKWARKQGFFDALFTNERGELTEGCISNVFFLRKGHILTPPTSAGLLAGVTRRQVIETARENRIPMKEQTVVSEDLDRYDGALVTNSVIEVLPASTIGDVEYPIPDVFETLREGYQKRLEGAMFRPVGT